MSVSADSKMAHDPVKDPHWSTAHQAMRDCARYATALEQIIIISKGTPAAKIAEDALKAK